MLRKLINFFSNLNSTENENNHELEMYQRNPLKGQTLGPKIFNLQIGLDITKSLDIFNELSLRYNENPVIQKYKNGLVATSCVGSLKGNIYLYEFNLNIKLFNSSKINKEFADAFQRKYNIPTLWERKLDIHGESKSAGVLGPVIGTYIEYDNFPPHTIMNFIPPKDGYYLILNKFNNNEIHLAYDKYKKQNSHNNFNFE